ncbi:MAG: lipocalin-like domain-containing protein [Acidobacteriota bacterium]
MRPHCHPIPVGALVAAMALLLTSCGPGGRDGAPGARLSAVAALADQSSVEGFARAVEPREFLFPEDHGPHPDYQTEWWYFTTNLDAEDGRRFGAQWTVFRRALAPSMPERDSPWASRQLYMGHFAVADPGAGTFRSFERFARGAAGLAGAQASPTRVWLEDWTAESLGTEDLFPLRLRARGGDTALDLELRSSKPKVLQGDRGLSKKSSIEGGASYYFSYTRLSAVGTLRIDGEDIPVTGSAWLDREWSTSVLAPWQKGWDWFSVQLDDGRELMFYELRLEDGSADPASSGVLVDVDGGSIPLTLEEVDLEVLERWSSPRGGVYPARWRLRIPGHGLDLTVTPVMADQELDISFRYWEGAVDVSGTAGDDPVSGRGYVELVGYSEGSGTEGS